MSRDDPMAQVACYGMVPFLHLFGSCSICLFFFGSGFLP